MSVCACTCVKSFFPNRASVIKTFCYHIKQRKNVKLKLTSLPHDEHFYLSQFAHPIKYVQLLISKDKLPFLTCCLKMFLWVFLDLKPVVGRNIASFTSCACLQGVYPPSFCLPGSFHFIFFSKFLQSSTAVECVLNSES